MIFINTKRFSPVIFGNDLPFAEDYYHKGPDGCTPQDIEEGVYDEMWWQKQYDRCINGYDIPNAIAKGGDFMIDGEDCFWTGDDCYIPMYGLTIKNKTVHLSGRLYFYLNFWWIYGLKDTNSKIKTLSHPRFVDMDFYFARRIEMMFEQGKDNQELKARQKGFSEKIAGMILAYNLLFHPGSQNIVVSGFQEDSEHTWNNTLRGLEKLYNTQLYKEFTKSQTDLLITSKHTKSWIKALTAKDKPQSVSRYTPFFVIHEEIGKGKKGWSLDVEEFVRPSLEAETKKTGYQLYVGTGGSMDEGAYDLEQRYLLPEQYNLLEFDNKWESPDTPVKGKTCHITPAYAYKVIDEYGNSLKQKSIEEILKTGNAIRDTKKRYTYFINNPIYGQQIFAISGGGYFGESIVERCNQTIAKIQTSKKEKSITRRMKGYFINPQKKWMGAKLFDDPEGDIIIYEEAITVRNNSLSLSEVPDNIYWAAIDSYDLEQAKESSSKGAMVVKKGFNDIVAYLLVRPELFEGGAEAFYEKTALLSVYFNVKVLIEHRNIRIFDYYTKNGLTSYLKLRPNMVISQYVLNSNTTNKYGVDPALMPTMLKILKDKLEEENYIENIPSVQILRAYAQFRYDPQRKKYNCDITSASAILETLLKDEEELVANPVKEEQYCYEEKYGTYHMDPSTGRFLKH